MTTPGPTARDNGRFRLGFFTSPAVHVTVFQAAAETSDPTCAIASTVSVETSILPPAPAPTSCKVPRPAFFQKFAPKFAATACAFRPRKTPKRASPSSAATFAVVKTFWLKAPVFTPKILMIRSEEHTSELQ